MAIATTGISLSYYITKRYRGYQITKPLHTIELDCDASAVNIRKTPEEKIAVARGLREISPPTTYSTIILDLLNNILFSYSHPSFYCRLQQMERMIAEQQAILDSRKSLTN